jgi:uncharacterized protein YabE (DUF348 family)
VGSAETWILEKVNYWSLNQRSNTEMQNTLRKCGTRIRLQNRIEEMSSDRIVQMKKKVWLILAIVVILTACQAKTTPVTILADGQVYSINTVQRVPAVILKDLGITLKPADRILYLGSNTPVDTALPEAKSYTLTIRRSVDITIISPEGRKIIQSSALTVGQAMSEAGYSVYVGDLLDPPAETPISGELEIHYQPGREIVISVDGIQLISRSAAATVGEALAEAGVSLVGLDISQPDESASIPEDGHIRVVRVVEAVTLSEKTIPFNTRTELTATLELDQQGLVQGGEPGLAITRVRTRSEDGVQVSQQTESESIVRPPQDRIMGFGTKIVIRSATIDGVTFEYYRAVKMYSTSYSPCQSADPQGRCRYGTASGLPVQRGTVAMVYSWYLAFGFDKLYIPGYGYATVGDNGGGAPSFNPYWVDLAWTDEDYQPMSGWTTVYFLTPVPQKLVYILP